MVKDKIVKSLVFFIGILFTISTATASEPQKHEQAEHSKTNQPQHAVETHGHDEGHAAEAHGEPFNPSEFIFEHIGDSYDWHLLDIGENQISVPLPIIIYSKEKGLNMFMSTKFHHGHVAFNGFHIGHKGEIVKKANKKGELVEVDAKGKIIETLADGSTVLPLDLSITKTVAALFCSVIILLLIFISVANAYKRNPNKAPKGLQSFMEPVILFVRDDIAKPAIGAKKYAKFMPYLLTVFFFILINNLMGLIPILPGGANVTGNLAVTMVLAFFTFVITTINGNKSYWGHIINTPGVPIWLKVPPIPIMPVVELIGVFTKPFILMVRLFANISAGHIIVMGFLSLIFLFGEMSQGLGYGVSIISVSFVIFMDFLELLVAFIQAYVFTFLSAIYFGMAVEEHH